jgi:archaemetzincin
MPKHIHPRTSHVPYVRGFKPPSNKSKISAVARKDEDSCKLHKAFDPGNNFKSIPKCESIDDWLAQYREVGQTYAQFLQQCPWLSNRKLKYIKMNFSPEGTTICDKYSDGKIYIVPLGDFTSFADGICVPNINIIAEYCRIFLNLPVVVLPTISLESRKGKMFWFEEKKCGKHERRIVSTEVSSRHNRKTDHYQLCLVAVLSKLRKCLPDDAICLLALTMFDLFEDKTDLFVAGMAAGNQRVAVFSLLRYDPNLLFSSEHWYDITPRRQFNEKIRKALVLQRSCKLVVHEICHLLGVDHCIFYMCCMNGSGHLDEDFKQPMYLCPVDLRKLHKLCGFDIMHRYRQLRDFFTNYNMLKEKEWVERRMLCIDQLTLVNAHNSSTL